MTQDTVAPDSIFADDPEFGRYISHHPSNRIRLMIQGALLYGIPGVLIQVPFLSVEDDIASAILVGFYAALALAVGWYVLHQWNREVVVYEHGFTFREGSHTAIFKFDEIASIRQKGERIAYFGFIRRDVYDITLKTIRGEVIKLTNLYTDIQQLGTNLERGIHRTLRPRIQQTLAEGRRVDFGEHLEVSQQGFHGDGTTLNWEDYAGYQLGGGKLELLNQQHSIWLTIPLESLYNPTLLVELLRERSQESQVEENLIEILNDDESQSTASQ